MILRVAAGLSLVLGSAALGSYLTMVGKGPVASLEARHLREMKDRLDPPAATPPMDFTAFAGLPRGRPVAEYSAIESRGVSLEGYVQRLIRSTDGDLHLEIAPDRRPAEAPDTAYVTAEITPQWQRRAPGWRHRRIAEALRPPREQGGPWEGGPRRVRVSGWLLYDFQYDAPYGTPQLHRLPFQPAVTLRLTGWEIHPVTGLEIYDEARGAWEALER